MSKSLGNVFLAKDFFSKYGANAFRFLILNTGYNQTINLEENLIIQANDYIEKIKNLVKRLRFYLHTRKIKLSKSNGSKKEGTENQKKVIESLLENLNTVKVLYILERIIHLLNKNLDKNENNEGLIDNIEDFFFTINILGFNFNLSNYSPKIKKLIGE